MPEKTVTIKQVAQTAGVSVGTVSRVINGFENISTDNLEKVRKAMHSLGYQKSVASKSTASPSQSANLTGNIGIYFFNMSADWAGHPLIVQYMQGIEKACAELDYHPVVEFAGTSDQAQLPRFIREGKVDAMLFKGTTSKLHWLDQLPADMPRMGLAMQDPKQDFPQVMPDNHAAGWQMAAYLWEMGHRRIACLMPQNYHAMFLPRRHGVEDFLRQHQAYDPSLDICLELPDQVDAHGHSQPEAAPPDLGPTVARFFDMPKDLRPTAVIAVNDWTAAGLYMAMFKQGKTIGKDLSIVGIDNAPSVFNMLNPGLTTYAMAFAGTAYVATRQLIQKVLTPSNCFHSSVQLITGDIVIRQSVADLR